jgi:hypothetical protein
MHNNDAYSYDTHIGEGQGDTGGAQEALRGMCHMVICIGVVSVYMVYNCVYYFHTCYILHRSWSLK